MHVPRTRTAVLAVLALTAAVALAGCASGSSTPASSSSGAAVSTSFEGKTVTLATDANYPPCQYFEEGSDKMVGYEVDLWDAIAAKLGVTLKVENTQFASLIPGVQSGRYDVAMECMSDSEEREKQVTFVNYIYDKTDVVTIQSYKGPITKGDDLSLCGQTMGAQTGFDTIDKVKQILNPACKAAGKADVTIQEYPDAAGTFNALTSGRVDFMILGTSSAAYLNKTAPTKINYESIDSFPQKYLGMAVAKDNTKLQKALLAGLDAIVADGTYTKILEKWGLESLALDKPGINLATTRPIK